MAPKRTKSGNAAQTAGHLQELTYFSGEPGALRLDVAGNEFVSILRARARDSTILSQARFYRVTCGENTMEVLENGKECKVYTDTIVNAWRAPSDRLMFVERKRTRRPYHSFPSSTSINEAAWVDKTIFKYGHGGVHIIFEEVRPVRSALPYFRVYCTSPGDAQTWFAHASRALAATSRPKSQRTDVRKWTEGPVLAVA